MKAERKTITTTSRVYLKQIDEQIRLIDEGNGLRRQVRELSRRVEALQSDYELEAMTNQSLCHYIDLLRGRQTDQGSVLRVVYSGGEK